MGGGVIDNNLFLGFDSPWLIPAGVYINGNNAGKFGAMAENRALYFFNVEPNTTYRYTAETPGDRMYLFSLPNSHDTPPELVPEAYPYNESPRIIKTTYTQEELSSCTFTTGSNDRMVYLCIAREIRPTGVRIVEVES